jgi:hypothetical protein
MKIKEPPMTYVAKFRDLLQRLSLDAALLATLALPALVLTGTFADPAQPGFHTESTIRHLSISEGPGLIVTMGSVQDDHVGPTGE